MKQTAALENDFLQTAKIPPDYTKMVLHLGSCRVRKKNVVPL